MADKLAELTWTGFTKKQGLKLDDSALLKALAKYDRADESKPEPRAEALAALIEQISKQMVSLAKHKKELGDKPFGLAKDKLLALLVLAEQQQQRQMQQRTAAAENSEEADSPVLLTSKMLPLVRELRKGTARMSALITTAGQETAVLIMRRAIAPTRRKLTLDCLQVHAAKHVTGECMFENGALTFVLASPAAGSAKRIRMALLKQLELRIKVRVRGDDGALDEDGEEGESEAEGDGPGDAAAPALAYAQKLLKLRPPLDEALRRQHPQATKLRALSRFASEKAAVGEHAAATQALEMVETLIDNPQPGPPAASTQVVAGGGLAASQPGRVDAGVAFKARMVALIPRLKAALLASGKAAQGAKLKMSEAGLLAGKKNFARADALLDEAEALLIAVASSNAADTQPHQAPTAGPADPPGTQGAGAVAWAKLLLRWRDAEAKALAAVNDLGLAILALPEVQSDPRLHHVKRAVALLPGLIPAFGETLSDVLDEGLNAGTNMDIAERAREVVAQYRQQLATAAALGRLEKFAATHVGELQVLQTLDGALADIAESLQ